MKKVFAIMLCVLILSSILTVPVSAAGFYESDSLEMIGTPNNGAQVCYNGFPGKSLMNSYAIVTEKLITNVDVTIPKPIAGQIPASTCTIETTGCELYQTDPVTWADAATGKFLKATDKFQEGKKYTVSIWLSAKSGYRFQTDAAGYPKLTGSINGDLPPYINKAYEQDPEKVIELTYTFASTAKAPEVTEPAKPTAPTETVHIHTPSQWRTTGIYHYTACTTCGDFLEQEDHKGGIATCTEKGKCTVCGYAYIEENENHIPDASKWIARGDMYHYHECVRCGAHAEIEDHRWSPTYLYQDATGHAWICADCKAHSAIEKHNPGPAATETSPKTCKDCGYIIEPAKKHKHDLSRVPQTPADCTHGGNIEYYFCVGCNDCFTDAGGKNKIPEYLSVEVGALGHTVSDYWNYDGEYHWRNCTVCKEILLETKMLHDSADGKCATCDCVIGSGETSPEITIPPTEANVPAETKPGMPAEKVPESINDRERSDGTVLAVVLVALVSFAASITATVILLKMKKKGE